MPAGQSVPSGARWGVGLGAGSLHWLPLLLPSQCCHTQQPHSPLTADASATRLSLAAVPSSGTICSQHRHARARSTIDAPGTETSTAAQASHPGSRRTAASLLSHTAAPDLCQLLPPGQLGVARVLFNDEAGIYQPNGLQRCHHLLHGGGRVSSWVRGWMRKQVGCSWAGGRQEKQRVTPWCVTVQ